MNTFLFVLYFSKNLFLTTKFYTPHPLLQEFIQCIMVVHAEVNAADGPVICPYPPTPQNSLFFYINDRIKVKMEGEKDFTSQPRSVIVGPQLTNVRLDINKNHKAVRVGFHPGGLHRLLGFSLSEMIDISFDAEDIFGSEMKQLNMELQEPVGFDNINNVIQKFLLEKVTALKPALPIDRAMLELVRREGNTSIEKMASLSCLSLRQFERKCKDRIGLPPKLFARLIRFSKAYRLRENCAQLSWTNIAYECGYFDQTHFIRDFKEFAGVAPGILEKELDKTPVRMQAALRL
jgi:AraC-like DNA-binding protein